MAEMMFAVDKEGETAILRASKCPNFDSFLVALRGKFTDLHSDDFPLKFVLEPKQLSSIKSQEDYENMILLCQNLQRCVVYLTIPGNFSIRNTGSNSSSTTRDTVPDDHPAKRISTPNNAATGEENVPTEKHTSKRKPLEEERNKGELYPVAIRYNDYSAKEIGRLNNAATREDNTPTEKQNFKRKLLEEERNEGESYPGATRYHDYPVKETSTPNNVASGEENAPTEKQKSKRRLTEEEGNKGESYPGATSSIPLFDVAPQLISRSLLNADWVNKITHVGQEFRGGVADFRCQLVKYASKMGFKFRYDRNDASYISAHCNEQDKDGCKWFVKGAVDNITKAFVIKGADLVHTCTLSVMSDTQKLGSQILGDLVKEKVLTDPRLNATQLRNHLLNDYGFDLMYEKVWRGLEAARANIFGSWEDSFNELHWYGNAIIVANPGSHVALETEEGTNRFKRFFVAFEGLLHGFKKCRPMLFVDATSMKNRYKGTLLSATARDGNNGLFPVAFAIVDDENGDNWIWFLSKLRDIIKHEQEIIYFSDRAGGLLTAFHMVWEKPLHFFCLNQLVKYLRGMYKGRKYSDVFKNHICELLRDAAYAPDRSLFQTAIAEFKRLEGDMTTHFLTDLFVEKWAVAFAPDLLRYGEFTSNAEESFNNWILDVRFLSMTHILDCIRTQLVQWFAERREEQRKWTGVLTPRMDEKWKALEILSNSWMILVFPDKGIFEVVSKPLCKVDLNRKTCSCNQWQITGFPCSHAIRCINHSRWNIREVVDPCFFNDTYGLIYDFNIEVIPTTEKHESIDLNTAPRILPPPKRKEPARPKEKRVVSKDGEKRMKVYCGRCGELGTHQWVTCNDAFTNSES